MNTFLLLHDKSRCENFNDVNLLTINIFLFHDPIFTWELIKLGQKKMDFLGSSRS